MFSKKFILELKEKIPVAADVYDFLFKPDHKLIFKPGQYMELVLGHNTQDANSIKRYFSIASSPTEEYIRIGIKFHPNPSDFQQFLLSLRAGDKVVASKPAGDFVLRRKKKSVFIAGGIGITPFRSMLKYLLDTKGRVSKDGTRHDSVESKRGDIILLYSNYKPADIVYKDVFDQAEKQSGVKTIYTVTDEPIPAGWRGERGFIDEKMIARAAPDYKERTFYLSGSHNMVVAFEEILRKMGVKKQRIKTDFFPGLV